MTLAPRSPWPWLIGGLALSIFGVASTFLIPGSRMAGLTPLTFAQCVAVFGGGALMLSSLALTRDTRAEQDAEIRNGARICLLAVAFFALLAWLGAPFALLIAVVAAARLNEPFRRLLAWLGRA